MELAAAEQLSNVEVWTSPSNMLRGCSFKRHHRHPHLNGADPEFLLQVPPRVPSWRFDWELLTFRKKQIYEIFGDLFAGSPNPPKSARGSLDSRALSEMQAKPNGSSVVPIRKFAVLLKSRSA